MYLSRLELHIGINHIDQFVVGPPFVTVQYSSIKINP